MKEETNLKKHLDSCKEYQGPRRSAIVDKQETLEEAAERYVEQITTIEFGKPHNAPHRVKNFIDGAKWQQEQNDTSKVKRVEVIQHSPPYNGRAFTNYNAKDVEIQFQDDGRTLKIFLK
jgi:hypothetical protein